MLTVARTNCANSASILDNGVRVARHYGFAPLESTSSRITELPTLEAPIPCTSHDRVLYQITRKMLENRVKGDQKPNSIYSIKHESSPAERALLGLHSIGIEGPIGEAILIATLKTFLNSIGITDCVFRLCSLGDKESFSKFSKEVAAFLRINSASLPGIIKSDFQSGLFVHALIKLAEKNPELAERAPNPMEYLNEASREHFRNVIEYIEANKVPYELDPRVLGISPFWTHTVFEVRIPDRGFLRLISRGGRVALAKGYKIDLPQTSAFVDIETHGRIEPKPYSFPRPRIYFAQLGPVAKKISFNILHDLHESKISVLQSIPTQSIGEQLIEAEKNNVAYSIIIGHKEAIEDTVIVRNMRTRTQVCIDKNRLTSYLRRLKF